MAEDKQVGGDVMGSLALEVAEAAKNRRDQTKRSFALRAAEAGQQRAQVAAHCARLATHAGEERDRREAAHAESLARHAQEAPPLRVARSVVGPNFERQAEDHARDLLTWRARNDGTPPPAAPSVEVEHAVVRVPQPGGVEQLVLRYEIDEDLERAAAEQRAHDEKVAAAAEEGRQKFAELEARLEAEHAERVAEGERRLAANKAKAAQDVAERAASAAKVEAELVASREARA